MTCYKKKMQLHKPTNQPTQPTQPTNQHQPTSTNQTIQDNHGQSMYLPMVCYRCARNSFDPASCPGSSASCSRESSSNPQASATGSWAHWWFQWDPREKSGEMLRQSVGTWWPRIFPLDLVICLTLEWDEWPNDHHCFGYFHWMYAKITFCIILCNSMSLR